MKQVLRIEGKAKQVFKYVALLNRYQGNVSLKHLAKNNETCIIDLKR